MHLVGGTAFLRLWRWNTMAYGPRPLESGDFWNRIFVIPWIRVDRPSQTTGEQFLITKRCGFGERIHCIRVDRRSIRFETYRYSCGQTSLDHWRVKPLKSKLNQWRANYSCGRSLNFKSLYVKLYRRPDVHEQVASSSSQKVFHFKILKQYVIFRIHCAFANASASIFTRMPTLVKTTLNFYIGCLGLYCSSTRLANGCNCYCDV